VQGGVRWWKGFTVMGLIHGIADGIKMIVKEDFAPPFVDKVVYNIAPWFAVIPVLMTFAVIPFGGPFQPGVMMSDVLGAVGMSGGAEYMLLTLRGQSVERVMLMNMYGDGRSVRAYMEQEGQDRWRRMNAASNDQPGWHEWRIQWEPGSIRFLLDGQEIASTDFDGEIDEGIPVSYIQDGQTINSKIDVIVHSAAIPPDHFEVLKGDEYGIPVLTYAKMLGSWPG
jgi:hypothetical protein